MDQMNTGSQYNSGNTQDPNAGVWPPPPTGQPAPPMALTFPFKTLQFYVKPSSVPLFRVGTVSLYPQGVTIQGKAVPRYEIQVPILIVSALIVGFLIVWLILEYAFRRDAYTNIPWTDVRGVTLAPKQRRVCLVYDAPNYKGIIKTFSLTFKLDPVQYDTFVGNIQTFLPGRVMEGKLARWTSPAAWVFVVAVILSILIRVALASHSPGAAGVSQ